MNSLCLVSQTHISRSHTGFVSLRGLASTLVAVLVLVFSTHSAFAQEGKELTAKEIIDKVKDRNQLGFESGRAQLTLSIKHTDGSNLKRTLDIRSKKISGKNRTLVTLLAPKELQNQAFLFVEGDSSTTNDIWMYLPAFKVTRRVEGSQKDASFLGSHFTYADLQAEDTGSSTYTREKDDVISKKEVYVVTSTPGKGSDSKYSKVVLYVRKSDFIPLKSVFYKEGAVDKTLYVTRIGKTKKGKPYAKSMTLKVPKKGQTSITIDSIDEAPLPDSIFAKEQLGK